MCGIAGVVGSNGAEATARMVGAMRHRGPDDSGVFQDSGVALGSTRLAILDLSPAAHQPMQTGDGRYVVVYNGEIYNFRELRRQLEAKGHTFRSDSDTEVLLKAYLEYADACVDHLRGMFAFAIWDASDRRLFAARDHTGIKPFLYAVKNGCLVFASELKALIASGLVDQEIDPSALEQCLRIGNVLAPRTILRDVRSLLPGQCLSFQNELMTIRTYWDVPSPERPSLRQRTAERYSETIARVRRGVLDSVKEQLVSDVPIGLFLSSGLDSSVLLAAMTAETGTVRSFTIGFEGDRIAPEWADSTVTANRFGARHETSIVTGLDIAERFDEFVIGLDQPSIDGLNSFWVSLLARQSVTVALSGLGGDESFGGYGWAIELIGLEAHATRSTMISNIRSLLGLRAANIAATVIHPHGLSVVDRYIGLRQMSSATRAASLRVDHSRSENGRQLNDDLSLYDDPSSHPARRVARLDIKAFMGARVLRDIDSVGMAHALEVRFPFLDHRLLSEAFEMPVDHKIDAGRGPGPVSYGAGGLKRVLYDAFAGEIGEEIRRRPKLGFDMPYDQWLRSDLLPRVEWALLEAPSGRFDRALLSRVLDEWRAGRIAWKLPWLILVFETWFQHVVRRRELPKIPVFGRPRIAAASPVMPH